jgi:hypothetical protein
MGSKISIQDIDRQAEIHAKALEIARLEKRCSNLEIENRKLGSTCKFRRNQVRTLDRLVDELRGESEELKESNKIHRLLFEQLRDAIQEPKELDDK